MIIPVEFEVTGESGAPIWCEGEIDISADRYLNYTATIIDLWIMDAGSESPISELPDQLQKNITKEATEMAFRRYSEYKQVHNVG